METAINITSVLANVATFLGIPLAIVIFMRDRSLGRRSAELETYKELQVKYIAFLQLCFDNPDLGLYYYEVEGDSQLTPDQETRRLIAYEIWVSMCECAYYLFAQGHRSAFRKRQWTGWESYIRDWARNSDFRDAWRTHLSKQFDTEFTAYMNTVMLEVHPHQRAAKA